MKRKLIEVALPLEAINSASAKERGFRDGHPSGLHRWWARRPLAACRAILFAQLVDDPTEYVDELLADPDRVAKAKCLMREKGAGGDTLRAGVDSSGGTPPELTLEHCIVEIERERLFKLIEELAQWRNAQNRAVLSRAHKEIVRCCGNSMPTIYDPFAGGGSIPLEAQRLGVPTVGSDLNPVAVTIGKALSEIPPRYKDMDPVHPGTKERKEYRNAQGLAEDIKYYGEWMFEQARSRIGQNYPLIKVPDEFGGDLATVHAWIWTRTVPSPNPAYKDVMVPITASFVLNGKGASTACLKPIVDRQQKTYHFEVVIPATKSELAVATLGTKEGRRGNFRCIMSNVAIPATYIRDMAQSGKMGTELIAIVTDSVNGRRYLAADEQHSNLAKQLRAENKPDVPFEKKALGFRLGNYGYSTWSDCFTERQAIALDTFGSLISEVRRKIEADLKNALPPPPPIMWMT